jgi:serine/threonine-protein kinase
MERFGRYVLLESVAVGGTAEVFRAALLGSAGFSKPLAIKRVLSHLAADPAFVRMLVEEAHLASALQHPNILQVLDLGSEGNSFFLAMEFVAGRSLNRVLSTAADQGVKLPVDFCVHVARDVLRALAYAHQLKDPQGRPMGVVHRDVSPQNVMVSYDGTIKLADFGIAKVTAVNPQNTGPIRGKPAYMAPEQVTGGVVDQRADVFAAGVVTFELLAGKRLHVDDNPMRTLMAVARGVVPRFEDHGADVPRDLAQVIYAALDANPSTRTQSALAFEADLDAVSRAHGWHHGNAEVAALMHRLFPAEIEAEARKQEHFRGVMAELASATSSAIPAILQRAAAAAPADRTQPALAPVGRATTQSVRPARLLWILPALLLGAGTMWFLRPEPPAAPMPAELVVDSIPAGATVSVDGNAVPGVTPLVVRHAAGAVTVDVVLEGHQAARQVAVLPAGGAEQLRLQLAPLLRAVRVQSTPPGAELTVDGKAAGRTPASITVSQRGNHEVSLALGGHLPQSMTLEEAHPVPLVDVQLVRLPMEKAPRPTPRPSPVDKPAPVAATPQENGRLTLQSRPWARIVLDGKDTGRFTPAADMAVAPGEHVVELINDEDKLSARFSVVVRPGMLTSVTRTLQ